MTCWAWRMPETGGVDLARAHGHKLVPGLHVVLLYQLLGIVDNAHGGNGKQPQVGANQQGLGIGVADAADAGGTVKIVQIRLKLGAEGGIFDAVDLPLKAVLAVMNDHAAPAGTQVGVVIHTEKNVKGHVSLGNGAKKASHSSS